MNRSTTPAACPEACSLGTRAVQNQLCKSLNFYFPKLALSYCLCIGLFSLSTHEEALTFLLFKASLFTGPDSNLNWEGKFFSSPIFLKEQSPEAEMERPRASVLGFLSSSGPQNSLFREGPWGHTSLPVPPKPGLPTLSSTP